MVVTPISDSIFTTLRSGLDANGKAGHLALNRVEMQIPWVVSALLRWTRMEGRGHGGGCCSGLSLQSLSD